jgi:hypothetical protein
MNNTNSKYRVNENDEIAKNNVKIRIKETHIHIHLIENGVIIINDTKLFIGLKSSKLSLMP